jgi:hypothetical protein
MMLPRLRSLALLPAFVALLFSSGCAEERPPINKVQANALAKSFFVANPGNPSDDPEFYWRNFVVDGSEAQELIGIGSWSAVDRIKWEISEDTLFARRSYSQNPGGDNKGSGPGFPSGTIVASYPITSHFDIKRAYNPQTGEELNVVEENTTDRPWYEREYFRVDWSVNKVETPDWFDMFSGKIFGELKLTPVAYYVSDPAQDDAPHFEPDNGYFDVTSKFLVEPAPMFPGASGVIGSFPQCVFIGLYTGNAITSCDAQEAVIRSSYYRVDKVDPDDDFEPFDNPTGSLDIFGNPGGLGSSYSTGVVSPPRVTWDPGYGYTDRGLRRNMHIHNIWKQSHQTRGSCERDQDCAGVTGRSGSVCLASKTCTVPCAFSAPTDGNFNGTDDQCENDATGYKGAQGAQCSPKNRCTIPYRDRVTKPIAFWANVDMPDELQDKIDGNDNVVQPGATEDVVTSWSQAVRLAVAHAREVECRRTGGDTDPRDECHSQYFDPGSEMVSFGGWGIEKVKDRSNLVVLCHNPVRKNDDPSCGEPGTAARVGDVRRNFIFYWPWSSRAPWGGIANWNADPLTGQIVGGAATVMGRSATAAAAQVRDIFMVANNELSLADITEGTPASLYEQRLRTGERRPALSVDDIARRMKSIDLTHAALELGAELPGTNRKDRIASMISRSATRSADPRFLSTVLLDFDARMKPLLGTKYEAAIMTPSWLVDAAGLDPTTAVSDDVLNLASPFRNGDVMHRSAAMRNALSGLSSHGICLFAPDEGVGNPDVRGVARYFGDPATGIYRDEEVTRLFPNIDATSGAAVSRKRAELIYDHLWKETYKGILLHEIGHALGMLHNWTSSYDSVNYNPQYWQLRTNEGQSVASCNGQPRPGTDDTCMGPRYLDPPTDDEMGQADESRPGINYFGHTSTMEYQNERFFETVGLGQYDVMTMGALYGRVLETFDGSAPGGVPADQQAKYAWLNFSQLSERLLADWESSLGAFVQPIHYTELARQINLYDPARCRDATAEELAHAEWRIVHGKVCTPPPKDHAAWWDFKDDAGALVASKISVSQNTAANSNALRWPYRWGVTVNAYIHTNPFDAGADEYEVTTEAIRKFDYSYPFNYFRRQRRDWYYPTVPAMTADRFFERLRSYHWVVGDEAARFANDPEVLNSDDYMRPRLLASTQMFEGIVRALLTPQVGNFGPAERAVQLGSTKRIFDATGGGVGTDPGRFTLDASLARFVDPDYNQAPSAGGSWEYGDWIRHAGFDVEKYIAASALTDGRPTLAVIRRSTYLDGRDLYINFRTDMPKAVDRVLGGILANDWDAVSLSVPANGGVPEMLRFGDDAPLRPAGTIPVFPNLGYRQQLGAYILANLYSRESTDLSLANKLFVYIQGTEGVIDIADPNQIRFTDPRSGYTYVAQRFGSDTIDGKVVDSGIASRMLRHANDLVAETYTVVLDANGNAVLDQYGQPTVVLDANGQPSVATATNSTIFSDYVGVIDTAVEVSRLIGHAPGHGLNPPQ